MRSIACCPARGWRRGGVIGLNHPTWLAYAKQFGLSLNEMPEDKEADSFILINGRRLVGKEVAQLWKVLDQVLQSMNGEARRINRHQPWLRAKLTLQSGAVLEADSVWDGAVGMAWRGAAS